MPVAYAPEAGRGAAGSVLALGARGPRFESGRPDQRSDRGRREFAWTTCFGSAGRVLAASRTSQPEKQVSPWANVLEGSALSLLRGHTAAPSAGKGPLGLSRALPRLAGPCPAPRGGDAERADSPPRSLIARRPRLPGSADNGCRRLLGCPAGTIETVAAMRMRESASSQPPSIHWNGQNRLAGW